MRITNADHTNWRVRDVERSLGFYRDVLGLEPFGLDEYERGEHPLVSLRVTPEFILHLRPDPTFEAVSTGGYDHLALVVEGTDLDALAERAKGKNRVIDSTHIKVHGLPDQRCPEKIVQVLQKTLTMVVDLGDFL